MLHHVLDSFPNSTSFVVFAGLAGLLPDADIELAWLFWEQHKHRIIDYV